MMFPQVRTEQFGPTVINASFEHQNRHWIICKNNFNFALFFIPIKREVSYLHLDIFFMQIGQEMKVYYLMQDEVHFFDLGQSFEHVANHCQNYQIWWCGNTILTPNSSLNYTNLPLPLEGNHLARQIAETIYSSIIYVHTTKFGWITVLDTPLSHHMPTSHFLIFSAIPQCITLKPFVVPL